MQVDAVVFTFALPTECGLIIGAHASFVLTTIVKLQLKTLFDQIHMSKCVRYLLQDSTSILMSWAEIFARTLPCWALLAGKNMFLVPVSMHGEW